jgi:hypothetical protein
MRSGRCHLPHSLIECDQAGLQTPDLSKFFGAGIVVKINGVRVLFAVQTILEVTSAAGQCRRS